MNKPYVLLLTLMLAACGKPVASDTVESLLANPGRLKEVQQLCKDARAKVGDATCNAAAEAFRRRFIGDGKAQYTPQR
jgi:hypothetical protein